jgi:hypothetical protein
MRDFVTGNLVFAYTSTMTDFNQAPPATERLNDEWRIYITSLVGTQYPNGVGQSYLPDLNVWTPGGGGRYFRQESGPFPAAPPSTLFPLGPGETVIAGTAKFGAPSMPLSGILNPYSQTAHPRNYMAFLGEAQIQSPGGRHGDSRPFIAAFDLAANGAITMQNETGLPTVEGGVKGRPAIVATSADQGSVFFAGGGAGQTQLYYVPWAYNAAGQSYNFGNLQRLGFGSGFESLSAPSVGARIYDGVPQPGLSNGEAIFEMTFIGKLIGRPHAEVFFARVRAGGAFGGPRNVPGTGTPVYMLPARTNERLFADGESGQYRALGVDWNVTSPIVIQQVLNGVATNVEVPNTRVTDRSSGKISFDTTLGGKAYVDTQMGTVRFAGSIPPRNAEVLATYTPRVMRVSAGSGAAFSSPAGLFDNRGIGEFSYWARGNNTSLVPPGGPIPDDPIGVGRYNFFYGRAAAGAGQAARPYLKTMRFGVQLPTPIHTQPGGGVTSITVTGVSQGISYYQLDPANGRVYFTSADEGNVVNVSYTGVDETTGQPIAIVLNGASVTMILERDEAPVGIDQAINENQPFAFIDPFDSAQAARRRPGLIWLFWTSTRGGSPDLYFQTIAPRYTPARVGRV